MPLTTCTVTIAADARPTHLNTATMTVVADRPVYYSGNPVYQTPAAFDPAGTALPHVNQAGLVDGNGDPVTDFAYIVTGELAFSTKTGEFSTAFQVFTGQATFELSLLREPDVAEGVAASAAAALESANDAAASAAAANAPTDAQVGTSLANRGLPTTGSELSASYTGLDDVRLDDSRVPTDGSVTVASLAAEVIAYINDQGGSYPKYGEETLPRSVVEDTISASSGQMRLSFFRARYTAERTAFRTVVITTASGSPTLARFGLYEVDEEVLESGTGTALTLVGSSANDTTTFVGSGVFVATRSLSTPVTLTRGTYYAIGALQVGGTPATFYGTNSHGGIGAESALAPITTSAKGALSDLPATITAEDTIAGASTQHVRYSIT